MSECPEIDIIDPNDLPEITGSIEITDVTEGVVGGAGAFDQFMVAAAANLLEEYKKGRITGGDYAQVYLSSIQAAMGQAIQFIVTKDKAANEAELIKYKLLQSSAELALVEAQVCKSEKEIELLEHQKALVVAQTWAEISKTDNRIEARMLDLLGSVTTGGADGTGTVTVSPIYTGPTDIQTNSLIGSTVNKSKREQLLLAQKEQTEQAQVKNTIYTLSVDGLSDLNLGVSTFGVVEKEKKLLQRQADGFLRDAEQKAAKIYGDAFAVQFATLDGLNTQLTEFGNADLKIVLDHLRTGINDPL